MLLDKTTREYIKTEASKNGASATLFACPLINIYGNPLFADEGSIVLADGTMKLDYPIYIKYQPTTRNGISGGRRYILGCSFLPHKGRARVYSYRDISIRAAKNETEEDKALRWILDSTNICEDYFTLARMNPGLRIFVTFDMLKYAKKINPEWKTYPTYMCGLDAMANEYYTRLRIEGQKEKSNENAKEYYRTKKLVKEAKRCQQ